MLTHLHLVLVCLNHISHTSLGTCYILFQGEPAKKDVKNTLDIDTIKSFIFKTI